LKSQFKGTKKVYAIDQGLIQSVSSQSSPNSGRIMENLVFIQLKRNNKEVYFYSNSSDNEVDFIIKENLKIKQLIQVCFNFDDIETKEREIKSLLKASKELKCNNLLIITYDDEREEKIKGKKIKLIPLWKWLLLKPTHL